MSVCDGCKYYDMCGDEAREESCKGFTAIEVPSCAEDCPHKDECPHARGIHQNIWKEGIECMRADTEGELPW